MIIPSLSLLEPNPGCAAEQLLTGRLVLALLRSCCPPPALITHRSSCKCWGCIQPALPQPQKLSGVQALLRFTLQKAGVQPPAPARKEGRSRSISRAFREGDSQTNPCSLKSQLCLHSEHRVQPFWLLSWVGEQFWSHVFT